MEKVFEIYIKTTPERLWEAITDPEIRAKYNFGVGIALGLEARLELPGSASRSGRDRRRARTSRSTRPAGSSRPSPRSGATT